MLRQVGMLNFVNALKQDSSVVTAIAGDGLGNVSVPSRSNYIYTRTQEESDDLLEVRTGAILPNDGDYILIGLIHPQTRIGGWRLVFWLRDNTDAALGAPIA